MIRHDQGRRALRGAVLVLASCACAGAAAVQVRLAGATLQQAAIAAVRADLEAAALRASVDGVQTVPDLPIPAGKLHLAVRPVNGAVDLAPRMDAWVDVEVDGRAVRSVRVPLAVHAWCQAWVAAVDAPAGTLLAKPMLALSEIDLAATPRALREADLASGPLRLRHAMLAGRPLTSSTIESAPAVMRGDRVNLRLSAGAITVEQRVEALQDGRPGQRVLVRAGARGEPQSAVVAGPGQVEIVEQ